MAKPKEKEKPQPKKEKPAPKAKAAGAATEPALDAKEEEWAVYADALQQAGDPRGELIALAKKPDAQKAFVKKNADKLLGKAAAHVDALELTWKHCYIDSADVRTTAARLDAVHDLLASPAAAHLTALTITGVAEKGAAIDLDPVLAKLTLPKSCVSLALVDARAEKVHYLVSRDYDPGNNLVRFGADGTFEKLWSTAPQLRHLKIVTADAGQLQMGGMVLPELRSYTLHSLHLGEFPEAVESWKKLESFSLRLPETFTCNRPDDSGTYATAYVRDEDDEESDYEEEVEDPSDGENYEPTNWNDQLSELMGTLAKAPLKRLALTSFDNAASIVTLLASAPLERLEELDLSDSSFDKKDAEALAKIPWVKKLKRLVLERVPLSKADAAKLLGKLGPTLTHSEGAGPTYRYVVGME